MSDDNIFEDDIEPAEGDSAILGGASQPRLLQVYAIDPIVVVGFGGIAIPDDHNLAAYRSELLDLLEEHQKTELAFDLTGVILVPSGIVGLLVSLVRQGIQVSVFNASQEVREVFNVTQVNQLVTLKDVDAPWKPGTSDSC
jgi:anti-sigma B factor antagonist